MSEKCRQSIARTDYNVTENQDFNRKMEENNVKESKM